MLKRKKDWLIQRMKFVNPFFWSLTFEFRNIFVFYGVIFFFVRWLPGCLETITGFYTYLIPVAQ
jgi:hypothetical protein